MSNPTTPVNTQAPAQSAEVDSAANAKAQAKSQMQGENQPEQAQSTPRKMKLKFDGQEQELTEEEVIKWAQLGRSSDKRFKEAAQSKRQAEEFIRRLRTDAKGLLKDPSLGLNVRQLAEEMMWEFIQEDTLTPEQKELRELKAKVREQEEKEREELTKREQAQMEQLKDRYAEEYTSTIQQALQKGGLPKTNKTVARMAHYMAQSLKHGYDLEPAQLANLVRQDYLADIQELFGATDEDTLLSILGDGIANKIRKADLKRLKGSQSFMNKAPAQPKSEPRTDKKMSKQEWLDRMERIKKGIE